jgi:penicillin G amidase
MRIVPFIISLVITIGLIVVLSIPLANNPPLGSLLSPQQGFWQNAEATDHDFTMDLNFPQLKDTVNVYLDARMVPHVFAQNEEDLYFVQGYLHARFRLWQMEFQTYAAAGRLTEIFGAGPGNAYLNNDRNMRRVGMIFGADNSLKIMERDPGTKTIMDAYTAGVNTYINNLSESDLPLEYRLLNYRPEKWTNFKSALFLKYMSYDLTGSEDDIEYTNARSVMNESDFDLAYPFAQDSLDPIVPRGTKYPVASVHPHMPVSADSLYFKWNDISGIMPLEKPNPNNGSNNWAVSGSKTQSGRPILCSDPHLGLNLPSLWFEMQLQTPKANTYGVSLPGSPAIIIGFNDSCAWGLTNSERDVKDYYRVAFKDETRKQYRFNGNWRESDIHVERFKLKNGGEFLDTVAYTIFGPVQYDQSFSGNGRAANHVNLAVRWKAHDGSNELKAFVQLNKSNNYEDYLEAIRNFACPGQNFVFADKRGEIAIWQQGAFPAKWKRQGDFIMPGTDSSYLWQGTIPQEENPHLVQPERGFVSSANQMPTDTAYPYYLGGSYPPYRGLTVNRYLRQMTNGTMKDMQTLQTLNYNVFAEFALPELLKNVVIDDLNAEEKAYLAIVQSWKKYNEADEKGPAIFNAWFDNLEHEIWDDELEAAPKPIMIPHESTLIEALLKNDNNFKFIDNIKTPGVENIRDVVTAAFKESIPEIARADKEGRLAWSKYKDTGIRHLLRLSPLSRFHLTTGGGTHVINAIEQFHGPSWRMIVQLTDKTEAYGIYPGGQSGNPGSRYYDNFIDSWASGKYDTIFIMTRNEVKDNRVKYKMSFGK